MPSRGTINKQRGPACRDENSREAQREAKGKDHTAQERQETPTERQAASLSDGLPDLVPTSCLASLPTKELCTAPITEVYPTPSA